MPLQHTNLSRSTFLQLQIYSIFGSLFPDIVTNFVSNVGKSKTMLFSSWLCRGSSDGTINGNSHFFAIPKTSRSSGCSVIMLPLREYCWTVSKINWTLELEYNRQYCTYLTLKIYRCKNLSQNKAERFSMLSYNTYTLIWDKHVESLYLGRNGQFVSLQDLSIGSSLLSWLADAVQE